MPLPLLPGVTKAADRKFKVLRYRKSDGVVQPKYDELQYAEYSPGGHFGQWHLDAQDDANDEGNGEWQRCMSVVLMISDSKAYTGGSLQFKRGKSGSAGEAELPPPKRMIDDVKLKAGNAVNFPAKKVWHRVAKTRSGLRRTVVFRTSSPKTAA